MLCSFALFLSALLDRLFLALCVCAAVRRRCRNHALPDYPLRRPRSVAAHPELDLIAVVDLDIGFLLYSFEGRFLGLVQYTMTDAHGCVSCVRFVLSA